MKEATSVVKNSKQVVIAVTGGISAYKVPEVIRILKRNQFQVRVVATESALKFVGEPTWAAISGNEVITSIWDETENVSHVDLAKYTDLIAVVPATADTISDLTQAKANSAVSALVLTATAPVLVFPAMHTQMWEHSGTQKNVETLRRNGLIVFNPDKGELTSGDTGVGRLLEPAAIAQIIIDRLAAKEKYRVLISAGGTKEAIDPVRYFTNSSSGKQGVALAQVAANWGYQVTLVTTEQHPGPWNQVVVSTAKQMHEVMLKEAASHNIIIMAAAVSDWTVKDPANSKIKKGQEKLLVELVATVDILKDLSSKISGNKVLVGFAAETVESEAELIELAREKLKTKKVDLICANDVSDGAVFGSDQTHLYLVTHQTQRNLQVGSKSRAAEEILTTAVEIFQRKYPKN